MKFNIGDKVQLNVVKEHLAEFAEYNIYPFKPYIVTKIEPWGGKIYMKLKHLNSDISTGCEWFKHYKEHTPLYKYILNNENRN